MSMKDTTHPDGSVKYVKIVNKKALVTAPAGFPASAAARNGFRPYGGLDEKAPGRRAIGYEPYETESGEIRVRYVYAD